MLEVVNLYKCTSGRHRLLIVNNLAFAPVFFEHVDGEARIFQGQVLCVTKEGTWDILAPQYSNEFTLTPIVYT
jgi:hypothetical protein